MAGVAKGEIGVLISGLRLDRDVGLINWVATDKEVSFTDKDLCSLSLSASPYQWFLSVVLVR